MRDIACAGYVAGGNTVFFAGNQETGSMETSGDQDARANNIKQTIMKRLSFKNDVSDRYPSLLAFPADEGQFSYVNGIDNVMSITGRLLPWEVNGASAVHRSFPGGEAMWMKLKSEWGLDAVHYGEDVRAAENMDFIAMGSTNNSLCFIGPSRSFNSFTKSHMELTPGQGHFGPDAIPGVRLLPAPPFDFPPPMPLSRFPLDRTLAGGAGTASPSRRRGTRWSPSRSLRSRSSRSGTATSYASKRTVAPFLAFRGTADRGLAGERERVRESVRVAGPEIILVKLF